jgi:hypothetical protein
MPVDAMELERTAEYLGWVLKGKGLSKQKSDLLLRLRGELHAAWARDDRGAESFPLITEQLLSDCEAELKGVRSRPRRRRSITYPKVPTCISDILPERDVRQIHEYLHEEPLQDALDEAGSADLHMKALARLRETLHTALYFHYHALEALPKPRGNWLHRRILSVVQSAPSERFTDAELAKLFDYLCPCGASHSREAIKKFRWRQSLGKE